MKVEGNIEQSLINVLDFLIFVSKNSRPLISIPNNFSKVFTGIFLKGGREIVTGHENGYVALWKVGDEEPKILLRTNSQVNSVVQAPNGDIYAGCNAGDLYRLHGERFTEVERILPATNTKFTRIFRLFPLSSSSIIYTSTYGEVTILTKEGEIWKKGEKFVGHSNAVFAISNWENSFFATGDYRGHIRIWEIEGPVSKSKASVKIDSYVSGLTFLSKDILVALGSSGSINIFENSEEDGVWRNSFETYLASGEGISLDKSEDGNFIFAATEREVLKIDAHTQEVYYSDVKDPRVIKVDGSNLLVITETGLVELPFSNFSTKLEFVSYQYFKIGLLGETSCGKTTLCNAIITGNTSYQGSTFGRHVWIWDIDTEYGKRKIVFNDNAGQEQVADTLLPLVSDSDLILFFFKKTSAATLRTAIDLHRRILSMSKSNTRSYLVETFIDDENTNVRDVFAKSRSEAENFDGLIRVVPTNLAQVETFKQKILSLLDWSHARTALQSVYLSALTDSINQMRAEGTTITDIDNVMSRLEKTQGVRIYKYHLKFLLQNLSDSGVIEYYPNNGDRIILDDPYFNHLRSEIPVLVEEQTGIVLWTEIENEFGDHREYVSMLDQFYRSNSMSIPFNNEKLRVFPARLVDRKLSVPGNLQVALSSGDRPVKTTFDFDGFDISVFLSELNDLNLEIEDMTRKEGILRWASKAYLYYLVTESQSVLSGHKLNFSYKIFGIDAFAVSRLESQFKGLLKALYGKEVTASEVD